MTLTVHVSVTGRVQGVGFREALRAQALRHGVRGWVRNRRDGSVEAIFQGDAAAVEVLLRWTRRGPSAAQVTKVAVRPAGEDLDRPYEGFDWMPSA